AGLPAADAADEEARPDEEDARDAARYGADARAAGELRRVRRHPHRGDGAVDDPGGTGQPEDHQRFPPLPDRPRLGHHGQRDQRAAGAVRAGEDDDALDGPRWRREDRKSTRLNSSHVSISYA